MPSAESFAGGLRNEGVRSAKGALLCFVDSDVLVPTLHLLRVRQLLGCHPSAIIGREYTLPNSPGWIERTWDALNSRPGDGPREWINAGNLCMLRATFDLAGGFDAALSSGEDTDLARRAREKGIPILQFDALVAAHLGNPKTLKQFFQKQSWHGEGASLSDFTLQASLVAASSYGAAAALAFALARMGVGAILTGLAATVLANLVPLSAVLFRLYRRPRKPHLAASVLLMHLFFISRCYSFFATCPRRVRFWQRIREPLLRS